MRYPSVTVITLATVGATLAGSAINSRFFEFPTVFGTMLVLGLGLLCFAAILFSKRRILQRTSPSNRCRPNGGSEVAVPSTDPLGRLRTATKRDKFFR